MPLRRSPVTPAGLHARRLNSLKSTGSRTARGKAWSCLNALRHGQRSVRRTVRDKISRTGDSEALYLFDLIFEEFLKPSEIPNDWAWRRVQSLAVRAWCIESGRRGRKVAKSCPRTKLESGVRTVRYAANFVLPRRLKVANSLGWGFVFVNPVPSRRRRVDWSWIPEVEYVDGKPPKARRVRGACPAETQIVRSGHEPGSGEEREDAKPSLWGAISKAVGPLGSSIFRRLAVVAVSSPPSHGPPPEDFWEDPEDYESESPEEFLFRHKLFARLAVKASARATRRRS